MGESGKASPRKAGIFQPLEAEKEEQEDQKDYEQIMEDSFRSRF